MPFAGVLACTYLGIVAAAFFFQSRLVYFPTRAHVATPDRIGLPFEDVDLTTDNGIGIHGWHVRANGARWTVLFLHGNGGNISHRLDTLRIFHGLGVDTLIIDYPGYGMSAGEPDEQGTYDAAMAAWNYLSTNAADPGRIVVFGRSLGGVVAVWLAARVEPAGLILESTFTSLDAMARHHYPFLPVGLISRYDYDALSMAQDISTPVLGIHSSDDEIVPYELGSRLYAALPGSKRFLTIRGGHNDGFLVTGPDYTSGLKQFLESL